jgi:hypothetical protein
MTNEDDMAKGLLDTAMDILLGPVIPERLEKLNRLTVVDVRGSGVDSPLGGIDNGGDVPLVDSLLDNKALDKGANHSGAGDR